MALYWVLTYIKIWLCLLAALDQERILWLQMFGTCGLYLERLTRPQRLKICMGSLRNATTVRPRKSRGKLSTLDLAHQCHANRNSAMLATMRASQSRPPNSRIW